MTNDSLLNYLALRINGQSPSADMAYNIEQILVETSLHLPSVATIVIHDPLLNWLDSATLEPGKELTVESEDGKKLFDGEIVEVEADLSADGQRVIVRAFDRLHRLARGTHNRTFTQSSDSSIVAACAKDAGLSPDADSTPGQHLYYIQANETDLAMLQRLAAANGFLLYADGRKLCFKAPASTTTITVDFNSDLYAFRPRLSATGYIDKTSVRGWDPQTKQAVVGESQKSKITPKVGLAAKDYLALNPIGRVADLAIQSQDEAKRVAQALTDIHSSRYIEAEGTSMGDPNLRAGVSVTIKGVGTRFSGTYFVTSATHRLVPGESYATEFSVTGLNPASVLSSLFSSAEPQQPQPLGGLTIGIVTDNKDPDGLGRVKVKFPLIIDEKSSQDMVTSWVRVVSAGAGENRGLLFMPEVNDEVVVGFGQGNINMAFVLGAVWNGEDKPPGDKNKMVVSGKVNQRVIYSRTGNYIMLDDSDADGGISLIDKKGNKIVLKVQDDSLTIETAGNVTLTTKGNLKMEVKGDASLIANGNISLEAKGDLSLKANGGLTAESMGQAKVKGTAGANLESDAVVTVKGSMINLN